MSEGEHTIISKIPRERLNQIASRKLSALGLAVRLAADRETLEGEMAFVGRVQHPITGQPVQRGRFVVAGHDHLRFTEAPLLALPPIPFYDVERLAQVEQRVGQALQDRAAGLEDLSARVRALGIEAGVDPGRLTLRAVVKTASHAFELLGGPEGVRVSRVAPVGEKPFEVSPDFPRLQLRDFASGAALAGHLVGAVQAMRAGPAVHPPAAPAAGTPLELTAPPRNAVTLETLSRAFGGEAMLAPNTEVELIQEFQHGGTRYRFVAHREMGTAFKGRLIGPTGDVWSERFELAQFPGARRVAAAALGISAEGDAGPLGDLAPGPGAASEVPQHLQPNAGEVWVMNVVVEQAGPEEVRYVGTDIDGRPYGAARVLKRSDFEAVFSSDRGGWRLMVVIDQVLPESVVYRQLDRQRQPIGAPRKMATAILVANFIPEAAAY